MTEKTSQAIDIPVIGLRDLPSTSEVFQRIRSLEGLTDVEIDGGAERIKFRLKEPGNPNGNILRALEEIRQAGLTVPTTREHVDIFNMRCAACVSALESGLKKIPGIADVRVNFAAQTGQIEMIEGVYDRDRLLDDIRKIGYEAGFHVDDSEVEKKTVGLKRDLIVAAVCSIAIFGVHMGQHLAGLFTLRATVSAAVQFFLTLPVLYAGRVFFTDALLQLRHFRANMNSLIALGSGSAFVYSVITGILLLSGAVADHSAVYFETTAMIITFILLGRFLEEKATQEARDAVTGMASLIPREVLRVTPDGREEEIDISQLRLSDSVIVRPGGSIPADGVITEGETTVDESLITGESMPVEKKAGDGVTGGTVNAGNSIKMKVTRVGGATVLARIIRMVREAQTEKAPIQRVADRVAAVFVPIVIGVALLTLILWAIFSPGSAMILVAPVAVLLVACPCAMGLATPTAILAGSGRAARMGILFRGGGVLERLTAVTTFVFDKTGTLTEGRPTVHRLIPWEGTTTETLLQYAASAERYSEHPFGSAIRARARKEGIRFLAATEHKNRPGQGLTAEVEGGTVLVGNRSFVEGAGIPREQSQVMRKISREEGTAVVFVVVNGRYLGAIAFTDTLKTGASEMIRELHDRGLETMMLTGDNVYSASAIASKLGIERVEADALPETKLTTIRSLRHTGRITAMVGDGVNDAAALAAADIGISLGSGTDIAVKASDITITGHSLDTLLSALEASKTTLRIIKQNLFWAFFYNVVMIPVAAGVLYPVLGLVFSPIMAAAAMALSSIFVVTNSLRLKKFKPVHISPMPVGGAKMAIDPVCKMQVIETEAVATSEYKGKTYYFCAAGCKRAFDADPEKYLSEAK